MQYQPNNDYDTMVQYYLIDEGQNKYQTSINVETITGFSSPIPSTPKTKIDDRSSPGRRETGDCMRTVFSRCNTRSRCWLIKSATLRSKMLIASRRPLTDKLGWPRWSRSRASSVMDVQHRSGRERTLFIGGKLLRFDETVLAKQLGCQVDNDMKCWKGPMATVVPLPTFNHATANITFRATLVQTDVFGRFS